MILNAYVEEIDRCHRGGKCYCQEVVSELEDAEGFGRGGLGICLGLFAWVIYLYRSGGRRASVGVQPVGMIHRRPFSSLHHRRTYDGPS